MILYIKYMVSLRCKMIVANKLVSQNLHCLSIELGKVEILEDISQVQRLILKEYLLKSGLELLDDKKSILIEKIKNVIINRIYSLDEFPEKNYSDYISQKLNLDYTILSNDFPKFSGISIQQFIILKKIERVKELLLSNKMNLSEIAYQLHYSSVAHLSNQFKKVTGMCPSSLIKHGKTIRKKILQPLIIDLVVTA